MNPNIDQIAKTLRAAAILTNAYVAATVIGSTGPGRAQDYNQLELYIDFTKGSLTTAELIVEFSNDGVTYFQESDETASVTSNVDTKGVNTVVHQFTPTGKYRLSFAIADAFIRVSIKGTGTLTSSSAAIYAILTKNYA